MEAHEAGGQDLAEFGQAFGAGHVVGMKRGHRDRAANCVGDQSTEEISPWSMSAEPRGSARCCAGLCGRRFAHVRLANGLAIELRSFGEEAVSAEKPPCPEICANQA